jgi:hypothetical protein
MLNDDPSTAYFLGRFEGSLFAKFRGKMADPFCGHTEKYGGDRNRRLVLAGPPTPGYPPFIYSPGTTVAAPELVNDHEVLRHTTCNLPLRLSDY